FIAQNGGDPFAQKWMVIDNKNSNRTFGIHFFLTNRCRKSGQTRNSLPWRVGLDRLWRLEQSTQFRCPCQDDSIVPIAHLSVARVLAFLADPSGRRGHPFPGY